MLSYLPSITSPFHLLHSLPLLYQPLVPLFLICAGIFKQSTGARNRVGIGLSFRPARLHNTQPGGIGFLESILGLLKRLKIRALYHLWCPVLSVTPPPPPTTTSINTDALAPSISLLVP